MRHNNKVNKLSRTSSHRKALMGNLSIALIEHKRIQTTLAKAKVLRRHIEPLITRSKNDTVHNRRIAFRDLQNKYAAAELFDTIGPKVADRPGGYTRIFKTGFRHGDGAEMAIIELVDFNEEYSSAAPSADEGKKKTRRRRKKKSGAKEATAAAVATEAVVEDAPVVEDTSGEEEE